MKRFLFIAGALLLPLGGAVSQFSSTITSIMPSEAIADAPVSLLVDLRQTGDIAQVYLMARPFGTSEFRRVEMELVGTQARVTLPARIVTAPFLEYYLVLEMKTGTYETYPVNPGPDPFARAPEQPLRLRVVPQDQLEPQVIFLSPDPNSSLATDDVVVSCSLLRADSTVARPSTRISLDGQDVTSQSVLSDDILVFVPANQGMELHPGPHTVAVRLFTRQGTLHHTATLAFTVVPAGAERALEAAPAAPFNYRLAIQAEGRREDIRDSAVTYLRSNLQFRGTTGIWTFKTNALLTSDETPERQPQHRYFLGVETPWAAAGYGDAYPSFSDLILSGKRVRGLHANLQYDVFHIDAVWGQITRSIEGKLLASFPADSFAVEFARDTASAYGRIASQTWGRFSYGTYERTLFAVRPSFGNNDTWRVGFTWLHATDDTTSIRYGIRPQQNAVLGLDVAARFDNQRIELLGNAAISAFNSDYSSGTFTDAYIDSVYPASASEIKRLRNTIQDYITVNENLRPLSLKKLSTVAYDVTLGLKYFDNAFSLTYQFRGGDYTSFGQSFLRTDVQGFSIVDRIRLMANELFLTLGYERLEDNTGDVKAATTAFTTINVAATYFPRADIPSFTVGYSRYGTLNDLAPRGPDSLSAIDDATDRFYLQSSYDIFWGARHRASLGVSFSDRRDASLRHNDVSNISLELGVNTEYSIPLRTVIGLALHRNTVPLSASGTAGSDFHYFMTSVHARYGVIPEILTGFLTVAPTVGDYERTVFELGAEWFPHPHLSLLLQASSFSNRTLPNESVLSLRCRYAL